MRNIISKFVPLNSPIVVIQSMAHRRDCTSDMEGEGGGMLMRQEPRSIKLCVFVEVVLCGSKSGIAEVLTLL